MRDERESIPAGAIFAILILIFLVACWLEARPLLTNEEVCAKRLGISYSREDGATERLEAFQDCVMERSGR